MKKYFCLSTFSLLSFCAAAFYMRVSNNAFQTRISTLCINPKTCYAGIKQIREADIIPLMEVCSRKDLSTPDGDVFDMDYSVHDHIKLGQHFRQLLYRQKRSLHRQRKNTSRKTHNLLQSGACSKCC